MRPWDSTDFISHPRLNFSLEIRPFSTATQGSEAHGRWVTCPGSTVSTQQTLDKHTCYIQPSRALTTVP